MIEIKAGATKPFEMLHISDSHLVTLGADDFAKSDKKDLDYFRRRFQTFGHPKNVEMFAAALAYARAKNLPILHTGDLLDFVTEGGLAYARRDMAGRDWFYAIGNHEYSGSGKPSPKPAWLKDARGRMEQTFPNAITCASRIVNGVNLVAIDNVGMSRDVFEAQFAAIKAEFAKGLPTVLAYHIPFYTPELAEVEGGQKMDARVVDAMREFIAAARAAGNSVVINSTYRDYATQSYLFERKVAQYGGNRAVAATIVAPPGTSEHQTGLCADIADQFYSTKDRSLENTATFQWMKAHCAEYGFILRFPDGKEDITGIMYEPWHFRYVGREAAEYIMENDLCLEEFLALYGVE